MAHIVLLKEKTIADLLSNQQKQDVYCFTETQTLESALKELSQRKILSAPVKQNGGFGGMISMMDIATYVAFASFFKTEQPPTKEEFSKYTKLDAPVSALAGMGSEESTRSWEADESASIFSLLEPFQKGVHRVLVKTGDKHVVVSQSDVVSFINANSQFTGDFFQRSLDTVINRKLVTVTADKSALHAFQKMQQEGISAIPVVDGDGKIVGQISASDLRGITTEKLPEVLGTVKDFEESHFGARAPTTVNESGTIGDAMVQCIAGRLHRVWVVNGDGKAVGVVTLSDLLKQFSE